MPMTKAELNALTTEALEVQLQIASQQILKGEIGKDRDGIQAIIYECVARRWNARKDGLGLAVRQAQKLITIKP